MNHVHLSAGLSLFTAFLPSYSIRGQNRYLSLLLISINQFEGQSGMFHQRFTT
jgi:hypothetical protein